MAAPGSDSDVVLLTMLECECQLSSVKEKVVCSDYSTLWQGYGRTDGHFIATDVGIIEPRNAPDNSH